MKNLSFKDWYLQKKGVSIIVNFHKKELEILDENQVLISHLVLSKSIDDIFNLSELFKENFEVGDYLYFVVLNGIQNKNFLWRRRVSMKL